MQVNWFTVIAQLINFGILVWLLKRYLYKPVLDAIEEREKKIAAQLNDAEAQKKEAEKEQQDFLKKNRELDAAKNELMNKALSEVAEEKAKQLEQVRLDAGVLKTGFEKSLEKQKQTLREEIAGKARDEVFSIAKKTLNDIASADLEKEICAVFINKINEMSPEESEKFKAAFSNNSDTVFIKSAFEIPEVLRKQIIESIHKISGIIIHPDYMINPDLVAGIELSASGYKLSWNIADYLSELEKSVMTSVQNPEDLK